jgi:formate dehydrogenase subunit delta
MSIELDHLIKMINQIADNIAIGEDEVATAHKVCDHINRFWAPPMKVKIVAYASSDGERLNTVAKIAVTSL